MANDAITKVEFLEEFAQYRPKSCEKWFYRCYDVTHIEGLEYLNTSEVTNMRNMFDGCKKVKNFDLSHFDTSKVTDMYNMFTNCESAESLDLSKFNTSNVTCMTSMFEHCISLKSLNLSNFNTAKVTDMRKMFLNCSALTSLNISSFDVAKVTDMSQMFEGCSSIPELDIFNFKTNSVEKTDQMFKDCSNLKTIYANSTFNTSYITSSTDMFSGCENLEGDMVYNKDCVDKQYARFEEGYFTNPYNRSWVEYADGTLTFMHGFKKTLGTDEYHLNAGYDVPGWWVKRDLVTKVVFAPSFANASPTSFYRWFAGCANLTTIEGTEYLHAPASDNTIGMFKNCRSLTSLNFPFSKIQRVNNTAEMFSGCSALTSIDLSGFNTENVRIMRQMFEGCTALTKLDISNFNTASLVNTDRMFAGCSNLKKIFVGDKYVTSNVTYSPEMFLDCNNLRGDIAFNPDEIDKTHATAKGGYLVNRFDRVVTLDDNGTLTFIDGDRMAIDEKYEFTLNEERNSPAWSDQAASIKKVVFDPSFANARPTTCNGWFNGALNLTAIEGVENLNTSEVKFMENMFNNCSSLESVDVSHFNTSKVTSMYSMFYKCISLKDLDLTNFDTSNVTDFYGLTRYDRQIKTLFLGEKFVIKDGARIGDMIATYGATTVYAHVNNFLKLQGYGDVIPYVGITPNASYGTFCVPVNGDLDDGKYTGFDQLYKISAVNADGTLKMSRIHYNIEAGSSYVYHRKLPAGSTRSIITFTASSAQLSNPTVKNDDRYPLKGTFESIVAPAGSYILQTDGNFHPVPAGNTTLKVGANRAYLVVNQTGSGTSATAKSYRMVFEDKETTGIDSVNADNGVSDISSQQPAVYFNLNGLRVDTPRSGNVYIVNGKKVVYNK